MVMAVCKKLSKFIPHNYPEDFHFSNISYHQILNTNTIDPILNLLYKIEEIVMNW